MSLNNKNRLPVGSPLRSKACLFPLLLMKLLVIYLQCKSVYSLQQDSFPTNVSSVDNITNFTKKESESENNSIAILEFWPWQILVILLYSLTAVLSLSLNVVTACVLVRGDRTISTELWKFLVNLSIADIGMAIFSIPFTYTNVMLQQWIFPHSLCPIVFFAQYCSVFVSVWTLAVIGIDRYFAIVHPLYTMPWLRSNKFFVIGFIWIIGSIFSSTQLFVARVVPFKLSGELLYDCREEWSGVLYQKMFTIIVFLLTFAAPVTILAFVYTTISYQILRNVPPGNPDMFRDKRQLNRKIKVLKMLITIVSLFAVCWFPIHLLNLLYDFMPQIMQVRSPTTYGLFFGAYFFSHFLSMFHSLINPIVYCFMSENFRSNLRYLLNRYINRIKSCDTVSTMTSENIELDNYFGDDYTMGKSITLLNSQLQKNLTKVSAIQIETKDEHIAINTSNNSSTSSNNCQLSLHSKSDHEQPVKNNGTACHIQVKDVHQNHLKCHIGNALHHNIASNSNSINEESGSGASGDYSKPDSCQSYDKINTNSDQLNPGSCPSESFP